MSWNIGICKVWATWLNSSSKSISGSQIWDKLGNRRTDKLAIGRKLVSWQTSNLTTWQISVLANWQIDKLTNWQIDKLANWQIDDLTEWQVDNFTDWQIGKLYNSRIDKLTSWKMVTILLILYSVLYIWVAWVIVTQWKAWSHRKINFYDFLTRSVRSIFLTLVLGFLLR